MLVRRVLSAVLATLLASAAASADDLRDFLTSFLARGITLAPPVSGPPHVAHFNSGIGQFQAFDALNQELALQLSSFPLPSSSGGFTYTYDPTLGTFKRGSESFGPIYAERVDTVGQGRFNLGLNYSHFSFDKINNLSLSNGDMKLVFQHIHIERPNDQPDFFFEGDVIQAQLRMKITNDITAFVATYGITNRFDVGFALPYVRVSIEPTSDLEINRLSTGGDPNPNIQAIHRFPTDTLADPTCSAVTQDLEQGCTQSQSASGIGDALLRFKYRLTDDPNMGVAIATDARFPTGKEEDLLGTGVFQIKAFLIASAHFGVFSPHINVGYTWAIHRHNNQAVGSTGIPDVVDYSGGFDVALGSRVTFAFDVLGNTYLNTPIIGVAQTPFVANTANNLPPNPINTPPVNVTTYLPQLTAPLGNLNTLTGSGGFKINPFGNLLVTINGLFSLNNNGLVDKFTPMVALDYAF